MLFTKTSLIATLALAANSFVLPASIPRSLYQRQASTTYTVAKGDTGYTIATALKVPFNALNSANPGTTWTALQVGQILNVPSNSTSGSAASSGSAAASVATIVLPISELQVLNTIIMAAIPTSTTGSSAASSASVSPVHAPAAMSAAAAASSAAPASAPAASSAAASPPAFSAAPASSSAASGSDNYVMYTGDGSTGWPTMNQWLSYDAMFAGITPFLGQSCLGATPNTAAETAQVKDAIDSVSKDAQVDPRWVLASLIQESDGCVRAQTTVSNGQYPVINPGMFQSHNGTGTCNGQDKVQINPCPQATIMQMTVDGVKGTPYGDGLAASLKAGPAAAAKGAQQYYIASRLYNSGSSSSISPLESPPDGTPCYSSDIANRLMGWVKAPTKCTIAVPH